VSELTGTVVPQPYLEEVKMREYSNPFVAEHGEVISNWDSLSSNGLTHYTTLLYRDGYMTCDCPGWTMQKKDKETGEKLPRRCKHTDGYESEARLIRSGRKSQHLGVSEETLFKLQTEVAKRTKVEGRPVRKMILDK